jgi:hypothetical protein
VLTIIIRVVGVVLALLGAALTVVGLWFAVQLGPSGTAEFTARPPGPGPVVMRPAVLNRVDADVLVTATPAAGGSVWMALANPSDADAVLGGSRRVEVTGVTVRDWRLVMGGRGDTAAAELGAADLWRQQNQARGPVSLTVTQDDIPETLVVAADRPLESLRMTITDKRWFVEAVVAALVGMFLLAAGVLAAWPRRVDARSVPGVPAVAHPGAAGEVAA